MRKQFTNLLAAATIATLLVGCGTNGAPTEQLQETTMPSAPVETASPEVEETAPSDETATDDATTDDITDAPAVENETVANETPSPSPSTKPNSNATSGNSASNPGATTKPNSSTTTKPNTNTKPNSNTTTKPNTNNNSSTTTPNTTPKPTPSTPPVESTKPEVTTLSCASIFNQITSSIELPNQTELDATLLNNLYGIDTSLLEDYCVKMPMLSFHITEIGVFKVKDAANVSTIVANINQRAANVGTALYPSLQDAYDSRVLVTKGNYILFAIDENASAISASFSNLVK